MTYGSARVRCHFHRFLYVPLSVSRLASKLRASSINMDILKRQDERVVSEVGCTGASWAVDACPGHWERNGNEVEWVEGPM